MKRTLFGFFGIALLMAVTYSTSIPVSESAYEVGPPALTVYKA